MSRSGNPRADFGKPHLDHVGRTGDEGGAKWSLVVTSFMCAESLPSGVQDGQELLNGLPRLLWYEQDRL